MSYLGYIVVGDKLWTQVCCETIAVIHLVSQSQSIISEDQFTFTFTLWSSIYSITCHHTTAAPCLDSAFLESDDGWHVVACHMSHVHTVCWIGDTVDSCLHTTVSGAGQWHHHHRQKIPVIIISLNILWLVSLWSWCVTHWLMGGSHSAQVTGRQGASGNQGNIE